MTQRVKNKPQLTTKARVINSGTAEKKKIIVQRKKEINLPQMANMALSESWLLKEMGDVHWELISKGVEQKTSALKNVNGNRMCAAFVRISYTTTPLNYFKENDVLDIQGSIKRFGDQIYLSNVTGYSGKKTFGAQLMSCFSAILPGNNTAISKGTPLLKVNHIEQLSKTPKAFKTYKIVKRSFYSELRSGNYTFNISSEVLDERTYIINAYYEINGVGLLYFASYPLISDHCVAQYFTHAYPELKYSENYHTVYRDIFYYANCSADDTLLHYINSVEFTTEHNLQIVSSIYRKSDNKLIGRILTVKQCSNDVDEHEVIWRK